MSSPLIEQAKGVLAKNWTGAFTKPAYDLYPHQWSWDSAFIALGYATYDQERAESELRSLFRGQWKNGLVPHIVFHDPESAYYPGPPVWEIRRSEHAPDGIETTGIIQPPVHATAVLQVFRRAQDAAAARTFLEEMYPALSAWHAYLHRDRVAEGSDLVYIRHPWESGMDNSPLWDQVYTDNPIPQGELPEVHRVDNKLVDSDQRPSDDDYKRYIYLVKKFAEHAYDEARIRQDCPFLVYDVLFNTILCQAEQDLAEMARLLGEDPGEPESRAARVAEAMNKDLWNEQHGIYFDVDLGSGRQIESHVASGFIPLYAGIPEQEHKRRMITYLESTHFHPKGLGVPSFDDEEPGFSPERYWRGPVWININWLLYQGLKRHGIDQYSDWVRQAIIELPALHGFREYFDPNRETGYGADDFSWTAALFLDVALGEEEEEEEEEEGSQTAEADA